MTLARARRTNYSAVHLYDLPSDGESNAKPATTRRSRRSQLREHVEDRIQAVRRNAYSEVTDAHGYVPIAHFAAYEDVAWSGRELGRVGKQIGEHPAQAITDRANRTLRDSYFDDKWRRGDLLVSA